MHGIFLACLVGGAFATALFTALGAIGGAGHGHSGQAHGGHAHAGHAHTGSGHPHSLQHGHHAAGESSTRSVTTRAGEVSHIELRGASVHSHTGGSWLQASLGWTLSWFSPLSLAGAAVLFGAAGLLTEGAGPISLVIAIVAAVIAAVLVRTLMSAFVRASVEPLSLQAEGAIGSINAPIRVGGTGEVIYTLEGLRRSAAARSIDGRALPRGTSVVIVRRERGVALVEPLDPLEDLPLREEALPPSVESVNEVTERQAE